MSDGERRGGGEASGDGRASQGTGEFRDEQLREQVDDLAGTLADLESELREQRRRPRLRDLVRFTREVTIPAIILVLRTNIEALRLLQRVLAFGDREGGGRESQLRERAEAAGQSALTELDSALEDLGDALSGRPRDGRARDLLAEARDLQEEVEAELYRGPRAGPGPGGDDPGGVDIDVDAELQSIKDELDDGGVESGGGASDAGDGGDGPAG
jgi:HPt (histidine-containing phosphotransfer) domain-containing protein